MGQDPDAAPPYARQSAPGVWRIEILAQPSARKSEVAGVQDGRLRIRLAAPPVDGKANAALIAFLGQRLGVRPRQLELVSGETSRRKSVVLTTDCAPDWRRAFQNERGEPGGA